MEKVELLSPAGSYEGLVGAIRAGADAIYLGGARFSARAYAINFDKESLLKGLDLAHLFKRRVYLTLNTLIKEKELYDLYYYLKPLYEAGLDAVIVQDFGIIKWLKENFPAMPIHASTQMNVTHTYGAEFLRKNGITRIIPARELSLAELKQIRKDVDIELETFIHGAMCYSYSGRCLFSSVFGGRSGNRGRCAQPCRLPYARDGVRHPENHSNFPYAKKTAAKTFYPFSLKDMCTIDILPDLIEAGISTFKIEGRMKRPEYTAGVTSIYRKYIDLYYEKGPKSYRVTDEDKKLLESLYIRSEVSHGYYFQKNNASMITPEKPSYDESDAALLKNIRAKYLKSKLTKSVNAKVRLYHNESAIIDLECEGTSINTWSETCQQATNQPVLTETVNEKIKKTGTTNFIINDLEVDMMENTFISVKGLCTLRRKGLEFLENKMLKLYRRKAPVNPQFLYQDEHKKPLVVNINNDVKLLHAKVTTSEQWESITEKNIISRIYASIDLLQTMIEKKGQKPAEYVEWYACLPPIIRILDSSIWSEYENILLNPLCNGVLISNIESFEWLESISYRKPVVLDSSIYIWNREAVKFWRGKGKNEFYLPLELNYHELNEILDERTDSKEKTEFKEITDSKETKAALCVYGRIPMIHSANCLRKTTGTCTGGNAFDAGNSSGEASFSNGASFPNEASLTNESSFPNGNSFPNENSFPFITDRFNKKFPVYHDCRQCYNIVYNSVPLSLHDVLINGKLPAVTTYRLDFTTETGAEAGQVLTYFGDIIKRLFNRGYNNELPYKDYTTGHIKRGVI